MRFSLVVSTLARPAEVEAFMQGLEKQTFKDFEVILVDQSQSDIYEDLVARYSAKWPLKHLRPEINGLRYARNFGANLAVGDLIAFPDDDCIYEPDTLERVNAYFRKTDDTGFITGAVLNLDGAPTAMGRWLRKSQNLNKHNIWTGLIEFNFFMPRNTFEKINGFDEDLGIGAPFGSAEGPDLALRLMAVGSKGYHDRALLVRHMDKPPTLNRERAYDYGIGMGYVLRKNRAALKTVMTFFIRPFGGICLSIIRRRSEMTAYYFKMLQGRLSGYFCQAASDAARHSAGKILS
ncbi:MULTISPECIES: glycosyltransferase family 2 protein [Gluconobacter]|uniref:Glycosyltransferase family 2 protein n=1 Tax=Gluconobacter cadivus TaxID=2728101 RepID=A0ABR9YXS8_9PROT|nr:MULTISPECIES: glycosyltransferase family A protein [Gluconobacter]MBF0888682.1 glycosyltransferase family 2 protein [Gluconobacter cadivus]MBS1059979.1 glycosyltransferase family 2 protein [Gluconobacter sp. Dm-44]